MYLSLFIQIYTRYLTLNQNSASYLSISLFLSISFCSDILQELIISNSIESYTNIYFGPLPQIKQINRQQPLPFISVKGKIQVSPSFTHFYKPNMSHRPISHSPFRPTLFTSKAFQLMNDPHKNILAETTKLEFSDPSIHENTLHDTSKRQPKEQQPLQHHEQDSTLTLHHLGTPQHPLEDDIDINVDDFEEDEGNESSLMNLSSENKEINLDSQDSQGEDTSKARKKKKNRKIRTTITRDKLVAMNEIFAEYTQHKEEGKNPRLNLKEIGNKLCLGYSTILHKFREFRSTKMVKGGALIASLQKKRKYKKSLVIEEIIDKALATRPFYTAVELSDYILEVHGKKFSRSIISRHLGEMGYSYKNLKSSPIEKNKPKYKETRRVYADIVFPYLSSSDATILYIDELACNVATFQRRRISFNPKDLYQENASDYVSLMVGATSDGILMFQIKVGFYSSEDFMSTLKNCLNKIIDLKFGRRPPITENSLILITDMNKIHLDPLDSDHKPIRNLLRHYNARRFYLPPSSPHLNPLESMFTHLKTKLLKKDIKSSSDLKNYMHNCMEEMYNMSVEVYFVDVLKCVQGAKSEESFSFQDRPSALSFESLE